MLLKFLAGGVTWFEFTLVAFDRNGFIKPICWSFFLSLKNERYLLLDKSRSKVDNFKGNNCYKYCLNFKVRNKYS